MTMPVALEVCVDDASGLAAAVEGGADRIELCAALSIGGLTPSLGLMRLAAQSPVPVYAMIRPRAGDFVFSPGEIAIMRVDIDAARGCGLAGVVLGASLAGGALDVSTLATLTAAAQGLGQTLHRAIDLVPDLTEAVEIAVDLGFERILTSGGAKTAPEALDALSAMVAHAAGRISIMPGSGVTIATIDAILACLAITEIHSSCSVQAPANEHRLVSLGFVAPAVRRTDAATVRALKAHLSRQMMIRRDITFG